MDLKTIVLFAIEKVQMTLDCVPGLVGLNQVYGPNCLTPSA